jgi:hypothetical protein
MEFHSLNGVGSPAMEIQSQNGVSYPRYGNPQPERGELPPLYGYEIGWAFAAILDSALTKVEGDLEVGDYRAQTLLAILTQEAYRRIAMEIRSTKEEHGVFWVAEIHSTAITVAPIARYTNKKKYASTILWSSPKLLSYYLIRRHMLQVGY